MSLHNLNSTNKNVFILVKSSCGCLGIFGIYSCIYWVNIVTEIQSRSTNGERNKCFSSWYKNSTGIHQSEIGTACGSYQDFLDRGFLLTRKLLNQRFLLVKLKSSFRTFYGRHHDLVDRYGISVSQMTTDMFQLS